MAKPKTDLNRKIEEIVQHTSPLPAESTCPILHFEQIGQTPAPDLLRYVDYHLATAGFSAIGL